ncbi:MAG: AsmA-like C-terminal region-containing protein [Bacteroidales bacterium]|nr:AsmA-like C-terminal region-containing protein [Bacteroidales bacterium]
MIKKIFKILTIVVAFLVAVAIILPFAFKGKIESKVKEEINNSVNAKVNWKDYGFGIFRSFPNFTLSLEGLTVVGVNEFASDTLANIKSLNVTIDLLSVIKGSSYKIKKITLDEPNLLLIVLKNGKANWDISKPSAAPSAVQQPEQPSTFKLSLQKVIINKGNLVYDAQDLGMKIIVKNLNHVLKGDMTADLTSLDNKGTIEFLTLIYGGIKYLNSVDADITAKLDADLKNFKFTFKENEFRINQLFLGMDGFISMPKDDIDMDLKFNAKKTDFKNFLSLVPGIYAKDFEKVQTKGKLALDGYVKGTYNDKKIPGYSLNIQIDDAMFKYPDLPKSVTNIALKTNITNTGDNADNTVINISKFHFQMGNNPVDIRMDIKTPVSDPQINGVIKGKINLAEVKDFYPLEKDQELNGVVTADITLNGRLSSIEKKKYEDFKALGKINISKLKYKSKDFEQGTIINVLDLSFSPQFVELSSCDMKIGKSDIKAKGRIDNLLSYFFGKDVLKGTFQCSSNLMDLNEFMQPPKEEASAEKPKSDTASSLSIIEVPENIDFVANATFGKILYDNMEMTNVVGVLKIKDKQVTLENLKMNMLDGQIAVNGFYNTKEKNKPFVDFNLDIKEFDIQKSVKTFVTMQKIIPIAKACNGKFSTKMKLNTALDSKMMPLVSTINGEGLMNSTKISIQDFAPLTKIGDALKMEKLKKLFLDKINFSFNFTNGKFIVKPFDFNFEKIKGKIGGSNSLDQTIDYVLNLEIPKSEFGGVANGVLNNLTSKAGGNIKVGDIVKVDALIGGTVTKPTIKLGMKGTMDNAIEDAKNKAKDELDKKKKEAEDKLKSEADKTKKELEDKAKAEQERLKKEADEKIKAEQERLKKEADGKLKKEQEKLKNNLKKKIKL